MRDQRLGIRATAIATTALVAAGIGADAGLAGASGGPAPPPDSYECPLPPDQSGIPGTPVSSDSFDSRELKGLKLKQAERVAASHDCSVRVIRFDGEDLAVTEDYSPQRINVNLRDDRIKRIRGIF